jgi:hypothetical protein
VCSAGSFAKAGRIVQVRFDVAGVTAHGLIAERAVMEYGIGALTLRTGGRAHGRTTGALFVVTAPQTVQYSRYPLKDCIGC